jgi:hypothetical protein
MNDYESSILHYWRQADDTVVAEGRAWYPSIVRTIRKSARTSGYSVAQVAAVYAANSINTPWARNLALAERAITDGGMVGGTLGMVVRKVNAILQGADIDSTLTSDPRNLKIVNFRRNLSGDYQSVTVDRWAHRVATMGARDDVPTGATYEAIATAYRNVAAMLGETPATVQAVTWVVARGKAA